MNGRIVAGGLVALALVAGGAMWYLQEYAFYEPVNLGAEGPRATQIRLTPVGGGPAEAIPVEDFEAIDAGSSPIRFRACFRTPLSLPMLTETFAIYDNPTPLNAPYWFDCFDARAIDAALSEGEAIAFLAERDIHPGVDRVVAVFPDGRAYAWHQLNGTLAD